MNAESGPAEGKAPPPTADPVAAPAAHPSRLRDRVDSLFARYGQGTTPIVPASTVVGRSLVFVTAIMCFLACLALGTAWAVHKATGVWTRDAAREVTVQLLPQEDVDMDRQVQQAMRLLSGEPGIVRARPYSREDTARLLEPWLGSGLQLDELPMPRMIALELDPVVPPDMDALARKLRDNVPGASLDDHRAWQRQIRAVAGSIQLAGFAVLGLMFAATTAIVVLATRGAMAGNKEIVDVLHLVGARQDFIAAEFSRHFLMLGLKGGIIGGAAASLAFIAARAVTAQAASSGSAPGALIQAVSIGWEGYAGIAGVAALLALLGALTSRLTVIQFLKRID